MLHIFEKDALQEKDELLAEKFSEAGIESPVFPYVMKRIMAVCQNLYEDDVDAIQYLVFLYERVLEDPMILPEERTILHLLDKLEEDVTQQPDVFGTRALFVLGFLEADILSEALDTSENENAQKAIGRIHRIRNTRLRRRKAAASQELQKPTAIKEYLDRFIIGQDDAKKAISTAVYGHMKRIHHPEVPFAGDVVLLIGPSGCGKTEIMRRIKELTGLPMVFTDVSNLGAEQFRGRHKSDILLELFDAAEGKKDLAEKGIIFMDEFDKVLLPAISERGVDMHDDVQSQLLTMLEGGDVEIKDGHNTLTLNTSRMLFVLAGAFQDIEDYIRADQMKQGKVAGNIGFLGVPKKEMDASVIKEHITHEVLMAYGMKRELAGRIGSIAVLNAMTEEDLLRILTEPEDNLVERYGVELELGSGASLTFTEGALKAIAKETIKEKTGARALFAKVQEIMKPVLYKAPSMKGKLSEVVIDEDVVWGKKEAGCYCIEEEEGRSYEGSF
ncbi:MAG: AAA family ATPase [Lachnospiraceae bacterium]|nr:AAA family ATPase [Lachnospiraceae bacterium]